MAYIFDEAQALLQFQSQALLSLGILHTRARAHELVPVEIETFVKFFASLVGRHETCVDVFSLSEMDAAVLVVGDNHHVVAPLAEVRLKHIFLQLVDSEVCLREAFYRHTAHGHLDKLAADGEIAFCVVEHSYVVVGGV